MNSSEPMKPMPLGREGSVSSQVSTTVWVRKSIQRLSAADKLKAERRDVESILTEDSSSLGSSARERAYYHTCQLTLMRMSLYLSLF